MNSKILTIVAIIFVLVAMLVSTNILQVITVDNPDLLIEPDDVKGIAVVQKGVPYTLNFSQQNQVIEMLNQMQEIGEPESYPAGKPLPFDRLIIYHFDTPDDMIQGKRLEGDWQVYIMDTGDYRRYLSNRPHQELMPILKQAYSP